MFKAVEKERERITVGLRAILPERQFREAEQVVLGYWNGVEEEKSG